MTYINHLNQSLFVEVAEANQPIYNKNQYYFELFSMSVTDKDNFFISSDRYMTMKNQIYKDNYLSFDIYSNSYFELDDQEAAISRNLANKYQLDVGDIIVVTKSFNQFDFVITNIFGDFYGDLDVDFSKNGLIILGFSESLYNSFDQLKIVSYHDELLIHTQRFILKDTLRQHAQYSLGLLLGSLTVILISIYVVVESLWAGKTNKDLSTIKHYDYSNSQIFIYGIINTVYKYFTLFFPLMIGCVFFAYFYNRFWFQIFIYFVFSFIFLVIIDGLRLNRLKKEKI
jgi:hypothetical protein